MRTRLSLSYRVTAADPIADHLDSATLAMNDLSRYMNEQQKTSDASSATILVVAQNTKFSQAASLELLKVTRDINILVITAKRHRRPLFSRRNVQFVTAEQCSHEHLEWAHVVFVGMCSLSFFYKSSDLGKIRSTIEEDIMAGEARSNVTLDTVQKARLLQDTISSRGGCDFDYWRELHCELGPPLAERELEHIPDFFTHTYDALFVLQSCAVRDIFSMAAQVLRGMHLRGEHIRLYGSRPSRAEDWWFCCLPST